MKYSTYLQKHKISPLQYYYLNYDKMEQLLKKSPYTEQEEQEFVNIFDEEMKRVFDFISVKQGEFTRRSEELEVMAKQKYNASRSSNKIIDRSSQDESATPLDFNKQINNLQDEIKQFTEFIKHNIVGFKRILKKHDRSTSYILRPLYKKKLKHKSDDIESLDSLFYRISKIILTTTDLDFSKKLSNQTFIRKTNKYWVPKKNILALKSIIVKHLPIYVYTSKPSETSISSSFASDGLNAELNSPFHNWNNKLHDTCISSVYFDNENFDLYKGRLRKLQGAEAIRIRWYTSKMTEVVFVERKMHEEDWTGEESKKLRFKIPERCVNDYINGKNVWNEVNKINTENKEDVYILYTEIQNSIINKKLRPITRTFYKRTAFQFPNSAKVRISLDTHLCMIKECYDFNIPISNWRRLDVNCEFPFYNLTDKDIVRFPYGVLEIKLQGNDDSTPQWITDIIKGNYVEHVHKFSKYIHGTSILYPSIVDIPYWLPQYHIAIDKEPFETRPKTKDFKDGVLIDIPQNKVLLDKNTPSGVESSRIVEIDCEDKRIAIPVRVEPKVFFANERTFLSWLHFSIFIGGIGTAMMGLGHEKAVWSGIVFIITSVLFACYALYLYFWRAGMIRIRDPGPYDDLYGPAVLVGVFFIAMFLSILFKFPLK